MLDSLLRAPQAPTPLVRPSWLAAFPDWPHLQVLAAGPGSGKTVGLALLLELAPTDWVRVWLSLHDAELDARGLFYALIHGVAAQVPGFGEGLAARLGTAEVEPRALWLALLAELETYTLPGLVLALDDVQALDTSGHEALKALLGLLAHRPPGLRVLLSSRVQLHLGVAKLESLGIARTHGPAQLHWTQAEVEAYLRAAGMAPDHQAHAHGLEGWPLGVTRWAANKSGANGTAGDAATLAAYMAEDVFAACSPPLRALLLRLALLPVITPAVAHRLCSETNWDGLLAEAEHLHLLQRLEAREQWRIPGYVREFLQAELKRQVKPDTVRRWHLQIAEALAQGGQHEEALDHYLSAGAWEQALQTGEHCFPAMRYDGRQHTIARKLDAFPAAAIETHPLYWLWRGRVQAHAGEPTLAQNDYTRAWGLAQGDASLRFRLAIAQANLALYTNDVSGLQAHIEAAKVHQAAAQPEDRVDYLLLQAALAERAGNLLGMQQANEAVLRVPCGTHPELIASHAIALRNLFSLAYHRGERTHARAHIGVLIAHANSHALPAYALFAGFMRALLHLEEGEAAVAEQFFRTLPSNWADALDWLDRCLARVAIAEWHATQGRPKEGIKELRLALLALDAVGFDEARAIPLERLVWLHLRHDDLAAAESVIAAHSGPWRRPETEWHGLSVHDASLALAVARVWQLRGEAQRAAAACDILGARLTALEANGHAARARLLQACAWLAAGETGAAREALASAEQLAPGSLQALCPARAVWLELEPLRTGPQDPVVLVARPSAALAREPENGPGLAIRVLGTFEVRVDGVRIENWPRKRAAQMLQALALYPRGLSRPALAELFSPTASDSATLRAAWSSLRKQLEPHIGARAASAFLRTDDDHVALALERITYCDVQAFEAGLAEGRRLERQEPVAAARCYEGAVRHYRGALHAEGCFEAEREALAERARATWLWLVSHHQRLGALLTAEAVLLDATKAAPDDEAVCLALMELQHQRGQTDRMRITYWDCRKALATLRGTKPSDEMEARYRALLSA